MTRGATQVDRALVLRVSPYGESDAVVAMLTERSGVVSAMARRARASSPRRTLVIEPFHTLSVELSQGSGELLGLRASSLATARTRLLDDATALERAGQATRWVRTLAPAREPEPALFAALERLLDVLPEGGEAALAEFGLSLLDTLGYGLELSQCARCGRPRPQGKAAIVRATSGGVLCEACRGGATPGDALLPGVLLDRLAAGDVASVLAEDAASASVVLRVATSAIEARARAVGSKRGGA
jgi:DNA repair protein RecO (recombination protein O)